MAHFWAAALACSLHSSLQAFAFCEARNLFFLPSFTLPFSLVAHVSHVDRGLLALLWRTPQDHVLEPFLMLTSHTAKQLIDRADLST